MNNQAGVGITAPLPWASHEPSTAATLELAKNEPWMVDALCAQVDQDLFYPEKGGSTREAKAICGRCTVAAECLSFALDNHERYGIWGGLSERERRKLERLINHRNAA